MCYFLTLRRLRSNDAVNPYTLIPVSLTVAGYDMTIAPTSDAKSGNPGTDVIYSRYNRQQFFQHYAKPIGSRFVVKIEASL